MLCRGEKIQPPSWAGRGTRVPRTTPGGRCSVPPVSPFLLGLAACLTTWTPIYPTGRRHPGVLTPGGLLAQDTQQSGEGPPQVEHGAGGGQADWLQKGAWPRASHKGPETLLLTNRGRGCQVAVPLWAQGPITKPALRAQLHPHGDPRDWEGLLPQPSSPRETPGGQARKAGPGHRQHVRVWGSEAHRGLGWCPERGLGAQALRLTGAPGGTQPRV